MDTPFIRARAKDTADELDNLTACFEPSARAQVREYLTQTLRDIDIVLQDAITNSTDPVAAYRAFMAKLTEYLPPDAR